MTRTVAVYPEHVHGAMFGFVVGALTMAAIWAGWTFQTRFDVLPILHQLSQCSDKGWITVDYPGGGQYTCTPIEQKSTVAVVRKPKRVAKPKPPEVNVPIQ